VVIERLRDGGLLVNSSRLEQPPMDFAPPTPRAAREAPPRSRAAMLAELLAPAIMPASEDAPSCAAADAALRSFNCPISLSPMRDPVVASDGHSYERAAITRWFARGGGAAPRSPCTNLPLDCRLVPNHALRSAIDEWRAAQAAGARAG